MNRQTMTYFNTTHLSGQVLIDFTAAALTQEDRVIEVYRATKKAMAWGEVKGFLPDMNEVSLKRSITNLYNKGLLIKTAEKVLGIYGKPTYRYKLA